MVIEPPTPSAGSLASRGWDQANGDPGYWDRAGERTLPLVLRLRSGVSGNDGIGIGRQGLGSGKC